MNTVYAQGARYLKGTITTLNIKSTRAAPSPINAANPPIKVPMTKLLQKESVTLTIPTTGSLALSFTAGAKQGDDSITLGNSVASVSAFTSKSTSTKISTIHARCTPTSNTVLAIPKVNIPIGPRR